MRENLANSYAKSKSTTFYLLLFDIIFIHNMLLSFVSRNCKVISNTNVLLISLNGKRYNTDFYIVHRYPLPVRPFYTMPCEDDPRYSNSFDVFLRGTTHLFELFSFYLLCPPTKLETSDTKFRVSSYARKSYQEVNVSMIQNSWRNAQSNARLMSRQYPDTSIHLGKLQSRPVWFLQINGYRYGAPPHGGFGMGLERMVMLFLGLDNIRKTSLFPRDPQRLKPWMSWETDHSSLHVQLYIISSVSKIILVSFFCLLVDVKKIWSTDLKWNNKNYCIFNSCSYKSIITKSGHVSDPMSKWNP